MPDYMDAQLRKFLYDVVIENRIRRWDGIYFLSTDTLPCIDKRKFLLHLLKYDDQGLCSLSENIDIEEILKAFYEMIMFPDLDNKLYFADVALEKVYEYYQPTMQNMIDDALDLAS